MDKEPLQTYTFSIYDVQHYSIYVYHSSRNGEQRTVEAVEHSAMPRQDIARVLYADFPFQQRLHKVSPCAEDNDHHSQSCPQQMVEHRHQRVGEGNIICDYLRRHHSRERSSDTSLPRLLWRDARKEPVLAQQRAEHVCPRVARPQEDEHSQGVPVIIRKSCRRANEAQRVERRKRQRDVKLRHEGHRPRLHRVRAVEIQLRHQKVDDGNEVRDEHLRPHHICVERPHRRKEICRRNGSDEAVDVQVQMPIGNRRKLPRRKGSDSSKEYQQRERIPHDASDDGCNE